MYKVYARAGWGSVLVDALLTLAGQDYELIEIDIRGRPDDLRKLAAINPLVQLPTIVTPDGSVMTESGAIALYIAEQAPQGKLAPPPGDRLRATYLRWQVFLVANVYASSMIDDHPERWGDEARRDDIVARGIAYRKELWGIVEQNTGTPWFLGDRFSTIDLFIAIMTRWSPRRAWFEQSCPRLIAIAQAVDKIPTLGPVWARNFGPDKQYQ
ncbi:MAG: glutathione S-transferase family protein [Rhodospirillaceae bacterium]|nr:glutathione S-transferase family protein [Rhodospirillaceae bacterium]